MKFNINIYIFRKCAEETKKSVLPEDAAGSKALTILVNQSEGGQ